MTMSVWSGPARVIAHATITSFWGNSLYVEIPLGDRVFALGFGFRSDPSAPAPRVDSAILADGVRLDLVNIDTPEGKGSAQPVLVGECGSDLIFLHFQAFRHGSSIDRTLHYTVFLVAKGEAGWAPVVHEG